MNMEESVIDLKDLLQRCLRKWKFLLVCMLVGAVIMNIYGVYQANTAEPEDETETVEETTGENVEENAQEEETVLTAEEYGALLTKQERADVEDIFAVYTSYRQQYEDYSDYCANSGFMKMDPQNVARVYLEYMIDDHFQVEYPILNQRDTRDGIIQQYNEELTSPDVYEKMGEILGIDAGSVDVGRYYGVWNGGNGLLVINIVAPDEEIRDALATVMKKKVDSVTAGIHELYGDYDITLVQEKNSVGQNTDVQNTQNSIRSELVSYYHRMFGLNGNMTEDQQNYYNALVEELNQ